MRARVTYTCMQCIYFLLLSICLSMKACEHTHIIIIIMCLQIITVCEPTSLF